MYNFNQSLSYVKWDSIYEVSEGDPLAFALLPLLWCPDEAE